MSVISTIPTLRARANSPMRRLLLAIVGAASFSTHTLPALADVVRLENGQTLEGDAVEANGQVTIHSAVGTISLPASLVAGIERGPSLERQAEERLRSLRPNDVERRVELALELEDAGSRTLARRIFAEVLESDADHPVARRALGYLRCGEEWLNDEDCHRKRGHVLHDGEWVSADRLPMLQLLEQQRRQNDMERLRAQIHAETARLEGERQAAAQAYASQADTFGNPFDPTYSAGVGVPFWPGYPVYGTPLHPFAPGHGFRNDRFGHDGRFHGGRGGFDHGRGSDRGGRHVDRGGVHLRGGQPPRPLVPRTNRSTLAPPRAASSPGRR